MSVAFRSWLSVVRDATRTQLWPLPTLAVVLAVAAGVVLPLVDAAIDGTFPASGVLFAGGADAARTVLSSVSGSLITVTSLTFSLTVVTLQLASSQFAATAADVHPRPVCAPDAGAVPGDVHLRPDRAPLGPQRDQRLRGVRAPAVGDRGVRPGRGQRARARGVPGAPRAPDPGGDDVAHRPRRGQLHRRPAPRRARSRHAGPPAAAGSPARRHAAAGRRLRVPGPSRRVRAARRGRRGRRGGAAGPAPRQLRRRGHPHRAGLAARSAPAVRRRHPRPARRMRGGGGHHRVRAHRRPGRRLRAAAAHRRRQQGALPRASTTRRPRSTRSDTPRRCCASSPAASSVPGRCTTTTAARASFLRGRRSQTWWISRSPSPAATGLPTRRS